MTAVLAALPTRGLDFGATAFVWNELRRVRQDGSGVLLISSDLDELFDICDRILVMLRGQIVAKVQTDDLGVDHLVALTTGGQAA